MGGLVALVATTAVIVAACSGSAATAAPTVATGYKACVAFDTGGLGDKGFNDLARKGLDDAAAAGFRTAYSEATGSADYVASIQRLIDQGCQTIVTVGDGQTPATVNATKANPRIMFVQVDTTWVTADNGPVPANFIGLDFQVDQAAMLAGYLAAGVSKSGIIGTYGRKDYAGVTRFMDGYYAGIAYYNHAKGTSVRLLGWDAVTQQGLFVNSDIPMGDAATGEQFARTLAAQNADVVAPVAGATGNSSIKYMLSIGKWAIGIDTDQALSLPTYAGAILTSVEKAVDVSVLDTIRANAGGARGGTNYVGTLANKGVTMSPLHHFASTVPAALQAEVQALSDQIANGSVKVADYLN